jgi:hypothetical protein
MLVPVALLNAATTQPKGAVLPLMNVHYSL